MAKLQSGDQAPPFRLLDESGESVGLSDFAGRRFVLYFYPRDDTPGCTIEATQFSALADSFAVSATEVVGVSPDDGSSHRRFRERHDLSVRLLSDPDHAVMEAYGAWGEKTRYGRTSVGVIRSTFLIGADATIEQAWYNVRAEGHAARVLAALGG
jgi:peroxiredoxin Q/BCP